MKQFSKALMASAIIVSAPMVQADSPHEFSANVALSTDYLFRGISQTDGNPAISGGFDYSYSPVGIYAGIWASNVDFSGCCGDDDNIEIDYYGGIGGDFGNGVS
ncbi:MAG: TorF family putative porin, partial [Gammaproteobacteria bacterium]